MMTEATVTVTTNEPVHGQPTVKTDPGQNPGNLSWLRLNVGYFKTLPGILKLIQVLFGIICMACASPAILGGTHWFLFVAVIAFISTVIWVFIYLLGIREALKLPIHWVLTELMNTFVETVLYTVAFIVQLSVWSAPYHSSYRNPNLAAGSFGLFNTLAYAAGTYLLWVDWKNNRSAN